MDDLIRPWPSELWVGGKVSSCFLTCQLTELQVFIFLIWCDFHFPEADCRFMTTRGFMPLTHVILHSYQQAPKSNPITPSSYRPRSFGLLLKWTKSGHSNRTKQEELYFISSNLPQSPSPTIPSRVLLIRLGMARWITKIMNWVTVYMDS